MKIYVLLLVTVGLNFFKTSGGKAGILFSIKNVFIEHCV